MFKHLFSRAEPAPETLPESVNAAPEIVGQTVPLADYSLALKSLALGGVVGAGMAAAAIFFGKWLQARSQDATDYIPDDEPVPLL